MLTSRELPERFCWTRFGTEAGQDANVILARKEQERIAGQGVFLWGVGNGLGAGIASLVQEVRLPELLFSPIRGKPRVIDRAPARVVAWTRATTYQGEDMELPKGALVTSGMDVEGRKKGHFALVCFSGSSLEWGANQGNLDFNLLRNLGTGNLLGASQVTAVVRREMNSQEGGKLYPVHLRVMLIKPYFVRLSEPKQL